MLAMVATGAATVVTCFFAVWRARRDGIPGATAPAVGWSVHLVLLVHRIVLAIAGGAFPDAMVVAYSWAALASAPLVPIGIALHEEANRRVLAALLADCGLAVVETASGRAALDLWRAGLRPDLVVTDQFMADGDGWSVLVGLADIAPSVPVVLISAALPRRPAGISPKLEFAAHLLRPLDHGAFVDRVGDLLGLTLAPAPATVEAPPPATAFRRPAAADLERLAAMIDEGRVSDMLDWAEEMRVADAGLTDFAEAVAEAARRLDFARLAELAGR